MSIEQDLYGHLSTYPALTAAQSDRVYPVGEVPDGVALPYTTYQRISGPRERGLGRAPIATRARFQLNVWAGSRLVALTVAAQLRAAVLTLTGTTVQVYDVDLDSDQDMYDDDTQTPGVSQDVIILYEGS